MKMICLRFAPGSHSSPSLKAWGFLAFLINIRLKEKFTINFNFSPKQIMQKFVKSQFIPNLKICIFNINY